MTETVLPVDHPPSWEAIDRLTKDLKAAARMLGKQEARWLVDIYYQVQDFRIQAGNQARAAEEEPEPSKLVSWVFDGMQRIENNIRLALNAFTLEYRVGQWLQSLCGIGPVITAGLLAHLDITKAPTVGHFWRFAGLDPTCQWGKGQKRPWNARLKTLCAYKIGESFVKVQGRQRDVYGQLFAQRKEWERQQNRAGAYKDQAAAILEAKRIGTTTEAYQHYAAGQLPPAHVHARARRWTVKLFLAHLHEAMYWDWYGVAPPRPYILEYPGGADHRHRIEPPNWPLPAAGKGLKEMGN